MLTCVLVVLAECSSTFVTAPCNNQVYYNGERLPIKSFQEYVDLYLGPKVRVSV